MKYSDQVMECFLHCQHVLQDQPIDQHLYGEAGVLANGDFICVYVRLSDGEFKEIFFRAQAGVATVACIEYVARMLIHKPEVALEQMSSTDILKGLSLPDKKLNSVLLALRAFKQALNTD